MPRTHLARAAIAAAVAMLIAVPALPAAAAPVTAPTAPHDAEHTAGMDMTATGSDSTAGKNVGTGSGVVYPDALDGRTFDSYDGEWSQKKASKTCAIGVLCASAEGHWFFNGTNGMLRVQTTGASIASGAITDTWTSPEFLFAGNNGKLPDENVVQYRIRANTAKFRPSELKGGRFTVQVVDVKTGAVVAQNKGTERVPGDKWGLTTFKIPGKQLKLGAAYQLRAVTTIQKAAGQRAGGTVDWDCVGLTARSGKMTGTEACGAGDTPPDPGEWVMGGGSSPVCYSPIDPLVGPLLATLKQIYVAPNQLAAGIGSSSAELADALLDPARPLAQAIGDLTGTFAATGTGLSGPLGNATEALQPFTEAIAAAAKPGTAALSGIFTPLAKIVSGVSGSVTKPASDLLSVLLSPVGNLAAPLIPIYDSIVRPVTQPVVSEVLNTVRPSLVAALGDNGTQVLGDLLTPLNTAAVGLIGPFTATLGTLHPIHATIVNLLDPIYTTTQTVLGPDGQQFSQFLHSAYVHSYPTCGGEQNPGPGGHGNGAGNGH